jgi:hypothetical protein
MYFDSFLAIFILFSTLLTISFIVRSKIRRNFEVNNNRENSNSLTGEQVAVALLNSNNLYGIKVIKGEDNLPDHFDPKKRAIVLRSETFSGKSISALSIAAHEVSHALQYRDNYILMQIAIFIYPAANFGASMSWLFLLTGIMFQRYQQMFLIGFALLGIAFLYQLINIPIEIDASKRALQQLTKTKLILESESSYVKEVLTAASHSYAAAPSSALVQFFDMIKRRF